MDFVGAIALEIILGTQLRMGKGNCPALIAGFADRPQNRRGPIVGDRVASKRVSAHWQSMIVTGLLGHIRFSHGSPRSWFECVRDVGDLHR
ncbi:MAG TPA: hypothetical protein DCP37_07750 [Dehalococcoidia bacterium]|nr:hypothetical protein [Dehalococcoidia bacterium]